MKFCIFDLHLKALKPDLDIVKKYMQLQRFKRYRLGGQTRLKVLPTHTHVYYHEH